MATRNVYRVVPATGKWQIKKDGLILSNHVLKSEAIDTGRKLAIANQPSQLVVHKADGTIETEWTYGSDPYPPKG